MQNFCYLIGDDKSKQALIVDPAWAPDKILSTVEKEGFKLAGFIVSHAHYDHTNAIEELLKKVDVPVYATREETLYAEAGGMIVGKLGNTLKPVAGGERMNLGETPIEFLHTPGHTPGSQCIRVGTYLITGDTLFVGGCGRSDLPGGDPVQLFRSLRKIAELPGELEICPGHDYGPVRQRSLREEAEENPYLKLQNMQEFLQAVS